MVVIHFHHFANLHSVTVKQKSKAWLVGLRLEGAYRNVDTMGIMSPPHFMNHSSHSIS